MHSLSFLSSKIHPTKAAALVEYVVLMAVISVFAIFSLVSFGSEVEENFNTIDDTLQTEISVAEPGQGGAPGNGGNTGGGTPPPSWDPSTEDWWPGPFQEFEMFTGGTYTECWYQWQFDDHDCYTWSNGTPGYPEFAYQSTVVIDPPTQSARTETLAFLCEDTFGPGWVYVSHEIGNNGGFLLGASRYRSGGAWVYPNNDFNFNGPFNSLVPGYQYPPGNVNTINRIVCRDTN